MTLAFFKYMTLSCRHESKGAQQWLIMSGRDSAICRLLEFLSVYMGAINCATCPQAYRKSLMVFISKLHTRVESLQICFSYKYVNAVLFRPDEQVLKMLLKTDEQDNNLSFFNVVDEMSGEVFQKSFRLTRGLKVLIVLLLAYYTCGGSFRKHP